MDQVHVLIYSRTLPGALKLARATFTQGACPCQTGANTVPVPHFIGYHDYYCEAGSYWHPQFSNWYINDPLWDGKDCPNKESPCCAFSNKFPWFYKTLPLTTENSIEVRVCTNGGDQEENLGISQFELYVK